MVDFTTGMNAPQAEAVRHLDGPLLVIAGAGSGKTRVITHRIANIIQVKSIRPDHLLAITFTNKAAREMQERVQRLIGVQTPWITTFHSAGLRILKLEQAKLGLEHPFTVLDEDDQRKLFRKVYEELKLDPKVIDPKVLLHRISAWKNQLTDIANHQPVDDSETWAKKAWMVYSRLCREQCVFDFDDLLEQPVRMFERDEALLKKYQAKFPYILVDEYQDTNAVQYRFIRLLGAHQNICATGDPDQAIYGWRGADISNILNFSRDYPTCKKILLEQNYRSTKTILRAADGVIANNLNREKKISRTENPEGKPLQLVAVDDEQSEAFGVAAKIDTLVKRGERQWTDFAVFYRTNAQSRILEDAMRRRGIPYRLVGGQRFYDREEVKHVLAWLKLLVNPADRGALDRVANIPARGMGEKCREALFQLADDVLVDPPDVLQRDELLERIAVGRNAAPLKDLSRVWRSLKRLPQDNPVACVEGAIAMTGIEDHYRKTEDEPARLQERIANIREVISAATQYREAYPQAELAGFLDVVQLNASADAREGIHEGEPRVTLMTLHAAKGLEFPVVFVTGCEEGVFPLSRQGIVGDLEEERRLMYVGITRAREELYLSRTRVRLLWGQTFHNDPSQFLGEIPTTCFESRDATGRIPIPQQLPKNPAAAKAFAQLKGALTTGAALKEKQDAQGGFDDDDDFIEDSLGRVRRKATKVVDAPMVLESDPYRPGDEVVHAVFGHGTVLACRGPAESRTICIEFQPPAGNKELQLQFAAGKLRLA